MSANAKQILSEIVNQRRAESYATMSLPDYFELFSAEQVTKDYGLTYEELEAGVVDGEHDGGIDSVFTFVNGDLVREDTDLGHYKKNVQLDLIVIQSKTAGGFSEDPINRIKSSLSALLRLDQDFSELTQYNEEVRTAIDRFRNAYRTLAARFPKVRIELHYAAMAADSDIHDNLKKKAIELVQTVQALFDEAEIDFKFIGAVEMLQLARQQPDEVFELSVTKSLTSDNGYVVLSTLFDYNEFLRNGGSAVRSDLFESNVRDFQGTTEVNSDISRTLENPGEVDFWWLNNGVTILGSTATLAGNTLTVQNPQIVNGLQTSSQIATFFDKGNEDNGRLVMIKVISSEEEETRDKIIKATNSQNSVPRASLRATDKVQRDIEHALKGGGYFYDRRKNYYKNQGRPASHIISIPLMAQAMMTLLRGEPDNARARPSSLIKEDDVYSALFSEEYSLDAYLVAADLIRRVENALKQREQLSASDRNNLRFYCLFWIAAWHSKSINLNATKLAAAKGEITETHIEEGIDQVQVYFFDEGGDDQLAKGPVFKEALKAKLKQKITDYFKG